MKNQYKILGLVLICLSLSVVYAYADSVFGTMWKQEGDIVYPADDVTKVDFNNISTVNMLGAGGGCTGDCGFDNITATRIKATTGVFTNLTAGSTVLKASGDLLTTKSGATSILQVGPVYAYVRSVTGGLISIIADGATEQISCETTNCAIRVATTNRYLRLHGLGYTSAGQFMRVENTVTHSSGEYVHSVIRPTVNSSGTAGDIALFVNATTVATGSGERYLFKVANNNAVKSYIDYNGAFNVGSGNTTSGAVSFTTGSGNTASGALSRAGGSNSSASESQSWAYGDTVTASAANSYASGNQSIASAPGSMVRGGFLNISTDAVYSVMFGSYANTTERDANKLKTANTMRLASMNLEVEGSVAFKGMTSITGDYNVPADIYFIECDATLANVSTFLPSYADVRGKLIEVKKIDASGNGCYIDGNGAETIDGATGQAITTQYGIIRLIAGAVEWLTR